MARAAVQGRLSWHLAEVIAIRAETARAHSITFALATWPGHLAGQRVDVRLTAADGYSVERSYSISSPPEEAQVTLTVERVDGGEVSPYLVDEVRVGDRIELRGPIGGHFIWETRLGGPLLLVAGGSGIAPLMAMLRHRAATRSTVPARLLYSSRSLDDMIFRDELARLASTTGVEVSYTLTRAHPEGWTGFSRRIDADMLRDTAWPIDRGAQTFICGPTAFVEAAASGLVELGHAARSIKTERFG